VLLLLRRLRSGLASRRLRAALLLLPLLASA
jgi:hypothetical protein